MRAAILNISLDDKVGSGLSVERRHRMVMACMRLMFPAMCIGEIGTARYDLPGGPVQEMCSVVQVDLDGVSLPVFEHGVRHISQTLGQQAIAVLYDDNAGRMIGPQAHLWKFDHQFFTLPAVCKLGLAAA